MKVPVKTYEKPDSGLYHGVLADIVDLGLVTTTFKGQTRTIPMVRFVWILDKNGKDGKPLQASQRFNISSYHPESNVFKAMKQILGAAPDVNQDLDVVLGVTRLLMIQRETSPDGTKDFANIMGILPPNPPSTVVPIPADFIRDKNRPETERAKNRQSTYNKPATPQQAPAPTQQAAAAAATVGTPDNSLEAQIAALQARLKAANQGADVKF